ncbi:DUF4142 domain-containing protein [Dongia soli]|uniref:DUF4142 domain-containing protein n=1 Tax=Dongia soli TaxID=600628 RepID=A0ABU5EFG4_9PROT|nr:DUF4142 domain-containing protein [Dongia soli]MDY0884647.1 DUF4142 domain-containing protein [Dongia soli]
MTQQHAFRSSRILRATLLGSGLLLAAAPAAWVNTVLAQDQQQAPKDEQQKAPQDQQGNPPANNDASGGLQAGGATPGMGTSETGSTAAVPATEPTVPADARPLTAQLYAQTAAVNNMFEIEASKLALTKSNNKDVKTYARHMIQDHEESEAKLEGVVQEKRVGVTLPTSMDQKHQDLLAELQNLDGDAFDQAYVKMLLLGHRDAIKLHQSYADNGETVELKTFAVTAVPMVEKHLQRIEEIAKALKVKA